MNHAKNKPVTNAANGQAPITTSRDLQDTGTHHLFAIIVHTIREANFEVAKACHTAILKAGWRGKLRDVLLNYAKEQMTKTAAAEATVLAMKHAASESAPSAFHYREAIRRSATTGKEEVKKRLVSHIQQLLSQLRQWFTPQKNGLNQPRQIKPVLEDLNETVEKLANFGRKRRPIVLWDAYESVNRHNGKLKLVKEIKFLCSRVALHIPERPLTAVVRLAKGNSTDSPLAKKFLKAWIVWKRSGHVPSTLSDFDDVFIYLQKEKVIGGKSSNGHLSMGHGGGKELISLCALLNLASEDSEWLHRYTEIVCHLDEWVMNELCSHELAKLLQPVLNVFAEADYLEFPIKVKEERRAVLKKAKTTERKRKQRQKIRPKA